MTDFERSTTVGVGADAAFDYFADPSRLPEYVTTMTHVETTAVDGELQVEAEATGGRGAGEVRFLADRAARRVEWGDPDSDYAGSIVVTAGTASTSQVTIRLHIRADADQAAIERVLDQAIRNIQRRLVGR